jgi:hypothetical protein
VNLVWSDRVEAGARVGEEFAPNSTIPPSRATA